MAGYLKVGVDEISGDVLRDIARGLGCPIREPEYIVTNYFLEDVEKIVEVNYIYYKRYMEAIYQWLAENGYIIEDTDCLCASCNRSPCTRNWIIKLEK